VRPAMLAALALADFRERVRRPAYVVVLGAAVVLGYLAVPATTDHWTIVNSGSYRGVYDSAYVGMVTALAGALWLSTGGFYVIRTAVARDRQTGVGELLAATPMRTGDYLIGKFLSNLLVLASMAGVLAVAALAMQLARGESRSVDPFALLTPFVLCTLPVLAVTAAAAIIFETTPVLRGGLGNIIWLFASLTAAIVGQSASAPFGGLGVGVFGAALRNDLAAQGMRLTDLALGLMYMDVPPRAVPWNGVEFSGAFTLQRLLLVLLAAAAALLPALWFDRFDRGPAPLARAATTATMPTGGAPPIPAFASLTATAALAVHEPVARRPRRGAGFARVLIGEIRILTGGVSRWWWLGSLALMVAGIAVPAGARVLLMAAWIWPVLVWSRLGCQAREHHAEALLDASPAPVLRTLAQWLAGAALTITIGIGPGWAMAVDGHLADWLAGAAFIPALALALGVISRTQRFFQAVYPLLWYLVVNDIAGLDYMGVLAGGPTPLTVVSMAAILLFSALAVVGVRHRHR
jgi:hypothetical protein